ncbi:MAG: 5'-nucleotidase [Sutterella sp.]|nr:5'-nucleotidase [Sutterella sp.]
MPMNNEQLVVAVSSRALFDLEMEHRLFEEAGIEAYRKYQTEHKDDPLKPGVAYPFVRRLLMLNKIYGPESFKVIVISRNSPETGQRFFSSCRYYNLPIKAGAFTSGQSTFPYLSAYGASLFLSANKENVIRAIHQGQPAGLVLPTDLSQQEADSENELRIAFDFDGVIVDDESEKTYKKEGLAGFERFEQRLKTTPHSPGPLHQLFKKLARFQELDEKLGQGNPYYKPNIRVAIVTARGAPSEQRLITTLRSFGMRAAELFLLDGMSKAGVLEAFRPHIFFDDQIRHLEGTKQIVPSVLIPFGVRNGQDTLVVNK